MAPAQPAAQAPDPASSRDGAARSCSSAVASTPGSSSTQPRQPARAWRWPGSSIQGRRPGPASSMAVEHLGGDADGSAGDRRRRIAIERPCARPRLSVRGRSGGEATAGAVDGGSVRVAALGDDRPRHGLGVARAPALGAGRRGPGRRHRQRRRPHRRARDRQLAGRHRARRRHRRPRPRRPGRGHRRRRAHRRGRHRRPRRPASATTSRSVPARRSGWAPSSSADVPPGAVVVGVAGHAAASSRRS